MAVKHKKLKEWIGAGLLTEAQADAIHAYEEDKKGGRFGRGLIGLSLFAILVGVLSIIASNWHEIPGTVKIGVHLLLNAAVGYVALRAHQKGNDLWREGATLVFLGLTFTLIILIGQVFQLTGTMGDATSFWFLITLPFFLLLGRGYMTAVPWMLAFLTTIYFAVFERFEEIPEQYQTSIAIGIVTLLPLALMGDGTIDLFRKWRPVLSDVALRTGISLFTITASISLAFWPTRGIHVYNNFEFTPVMATIILAMGFAGMAVHAFFHGFYKNDLVRKYGALFAGLSMLSIIVPVIAPIGDSAILKAIAFISYWVFIGWLAQSLHRMRILSLAIAVIAIRIFIVYVEVFGSLMQTGLGLISGGVVMLALIYAARRLNKRLTKKVAA
jgi:uncharacterized membrane protein